MAPAGSDGCRIGEVLALTRADLLPDGLLIDESALDGHPSTTKNKKSRTVPIPASLRSELEEWLADHNHSLMFPTQAGKMHHRGDLHLREVVKRARSAAKIPDLTSRMCRNTFGSLFEGDVKDAQEILGHHSAAFTLQVYKKPLAERQQTAVEDVDRRLKVVPIKNGGSLTVSSTAVHTGTEKANVFSHLVIPVRCLKTR